MKGTCSWCDGSGSLEAENRPDVMINYKNPCTACGGTGEVELKDPTHKDIGAKLREAREMAGLSQAAAGKLIGMHQSTISLLEKGQQVLSALELRQFCDMYAVSPEWIIGMIADCDVPQEWVDMIEKLPDRLDRRKLIHVIAMNF